MKSPTLASSESPLFDNLERLSLPGSSASQISTGDNRDLFGGMGGGIESNSNPGEITFVTPFIRGVSLVQMFSQEGVCCARVGTSGNKMCFRQVNEGQCPQSHSKNKVDLKLQGPTLFRIDAGLSSSTTLIITPKLRVTESVNAIVQSLMYKQYSEETWMDEVSACEGAETLDKDVEEFKAEFNRELASIQTPLQRKQARLKEFELDEATGVLSDQDRVERLRARHLHFQSVVQDTATAFLGSQPISDNSAAAAYFEANQRKEEMLSGMLQATTNMMDAGLKASGADINDLSSAMSLLKLEVRAVKSRMGTKTQELDFLAGSSVWEAIQDLTHLGIDTGLLKLQAGGISVSETSFVQALVSDKSPLGNLLTSYRQKIGDLEAKMQQLLTVQGLSSTMSAQPATGTVPAGISEEMLSLTAKLSNLERRMTNSQTVGSDMSVQFRNQIFNTQGDVSNYIRQFLDSPSVSPSLVNDAFTLLHAISKGLAGESMEVKDIYSVSRMGEGISEADILNAIAGNQTGVPPFFKGNRATLSGVYTGTGTGPKHRLKGIPSYAAWGHPGSNDGIKYKSLMHLDRIVQTARYDIHARISNPTMSSFLENMLERSQEFVRKLFTFITDTYTELMRSFNDDERTWDFVCQCIEHIFAHEFDVARSILRGHDVTSVDFNERMMWTSLRTIVVQETFLSKGIDNHKCLAGAYYKFLMRNSQSTQVTSMNKTVEKMAATNESLVKKLAAAEAKIKGAEGTADRAARAVKELERKFDKLK